GLVVPFSGFVHWTFTGNGSLLFDVSPTAKLTDRALLAIAGFVLAHAAVCWLVIRRGWHRDDLDLWLWLAAGLIAVAAGLRFFEHYWMQALPPLCLLAAPAIERFTRNGRRVMVAFVAVPTVFAWWAAWSPALRAHPPELFLDTSTGDIRGYGRYPPSLLPGLESFLDAHYKPTESVDGVAISRFKA